MNPNARIPTHAINFTDSHPPKHVAALFTGAPIPGSITEAEVCKLQVSPSELLMLEILNKVIVTIG